MTPRMGEYLVGAYLKVVEECEFVDYNVRPPGGGHRGLDELDVIGFSFHKGTAYLCEVVTHIRGLDYGKGYEDTVERVRVKLAKQRQYATENLPTQLGKHAFMLWSPVVPKGLRERLEGITGLELIINQEYTRRVDELRDQARKITHDVGNPAFRLLQILEHARRLSQ